MATATRATATTTTAAERALPNDLLTIGAIALLVGLIGTIVHEALGHGLAVIAVGGQLLRVTSVDAEFPDAGIGEWARRFIAAAGIIANLIVGLLAFGGLRAARRATWRYFLWLLGFSNLLVGGGYLLALSFASFGDVHQFVQGLPNRTLWQLGSTALGVLISFAARRVGLRLLDPFLGWERTARRRRALGLALLPYFVIGLASVAAGALNPTDPLLILTSAGASSFGGNAFMAWLPLWVRAECPTTPREPLTIVRSWPWIIAGIVALAIRLIVLGPGVPR
jgi:hypothetical protein